MSHYAYLGKDATAKKIMEQISDQEIINPFITMNLDQENWITNNKCLQGNIIPINDHAVYLCYPYSHKIDQNLLH